MSMPQSQIETKTKLQGPDSSVDVSLQSLPSLSSAKISSNVDWVNMELEDMGKSIFTNYPLSKDRQELKVSSIRTAVSLDDVALLKSLAVSRKGLISNELRRQVWPKLLGLEKAQLHSDTSEWDAAPPHPDEHQVQLDINRSFTHYPKSVGAEKLAILRSSLWKVIVRVLRKHTELCYYQGYHDIAQLILLVFDGNVDASFAVLETLSLFHLRDYMMPSIDSSVDQLQLVLAVMRKKDANFFKILNNLKPYYCLSSVITLFTHDVSEFEDICMIFDFLLANNSCNLSLSLVYLYCSFLLSEKTSILNGIFENIYEKISTETLSNSFLSESDTLTGSSGSNSGENSCELERSPHPLSDTLKTAAMSYSDFAGYDDNDIELINYDHLHNVLSNLVATYFSNLHLASKDASGELFYIFKTATELMNSIDISEDISNTVSSYSTISNSNIKSMSEAENLLHLHREQVLEQQRVAKEEQRKKFEELMRQRKAEKAEKEATLVSKNYLSLILYPIQLGNSQLTRVFGSKFVKISVFIGVLSILLNVYLHKSHTRVYTNWGSSLGANLGSNFYSFGRNFQVGIKSVINDESVQINFFDDIKGLFSDVSQKVSQFL